MYLRIYRVTSLSFIIFALDFDQLTLSPTLVFNQSIGVANASTGFSGDCWFIPCSFAGLFTFLNRRGWDFGRRLGSYNAQSHLY